MSITRPFFLADHGLSHYQPSRPPCSRRIRRFLQIPTRPLASLPLLLRLRDMSFHTFHSSSSSFALNNPGGYCPPVSSRNSAKTLFPRILDALVSPSRKGKARVRPILYSFDVYSYVDILPLDDEEGELIDVARFVGDTPGSRKLAVQVILCLDLAVRACRAHGALSQTTTLCDGTFSAPRLQQERT